MRMENKEKRTNKDSKRSEGVRPGQNEAMETNCWDGTGLNSEKRVGSGRVGSGRVGWVGFGRGQSGWFASVGWSPFIHLLSPKCEAVLELEVIRCFSVIFSFVFCCFGFGFP